MAGRFLNLSLDTTLGGLGASDYLAPSQRAIKTYVDNQVQGTGNLFSIVFKDVINDDREGCAELGSSVYYAEYPDFYNTCIAEKAEAVATTTTLDEDEITTYVHENGHIYYDIADQDTILAYYAKHRACWMYGVDTTNKLIVMPNNDYLNFINEQEPIKYAVELECSVTYGNTTDTGTCEVFKATKIPYIIVK